MDKQALYDQILEFNNTLTDSSDTNSKTYGNARFYVHDDEAIDKASFINYLMSEKILKNSYDYILDMTFGSGNLTSHIIFDNDIKYESIILNDNNPGKTNQDIKNYIDNCSIEHYDILDESISDDIEANFIIINPQIRGSYTEGDITKQKQANERIQDVFNKISTNIDKFLTSGATIVFYGKAKDFDSLCKGKNYIRYITDNQQLYIINNEITTNRCFSKIDGNFEEIDCDLNDDSIDEEIDDFDDLIIELDQYVSKEKSLKIDNEEAFRKWWLNSNYDSVDGKPYAESTKQGYLRALKQLKSELHDFGFENINVFEINEIDKLNDLLARLESGDLIAYNKRHQNYDTSNGVKQYIRFLEDNSLDGFSISETMQSIKQGNDLLIFSNEPKGKLDFKCQNILFKGVPGTGKSKAIDKIINDKLEMQDLSENILRINIHSASSNSDLMQGISISTTNNNENVLYKEKRGAILNHIFKSIYKPKQPFALVLEEIQENSLNELIGDLIYLIEDKKRTAVDLDIQDDTFIGYSELFEKIYDKAKDKNENLHYVELPSLVENSNHNVKMIIPDNLFIFCTSNYRDDKKVIEDNLLRRFDVIEIYPKTREQLGTNDSNEYVFKSQDVSDFLEKLNMQILKQFKDETHPDRYMIGHANWLDIKEEDNEDNKIAFYKGLLKVIIEFKEIREIDFDNEVKPILENVLIKDEKISDRLAEYLKIFYKDDKLELTSYKNIVDLLQQEVYKSFL